MQRYHYDPGGGYRYNPNPQRPPRRDGDWGDWVGIAVLFFIPSKITKLIALLWLAGRFVNMSRAQRMKYENQARQAAQFVKNKADATFRQGQSWTAPSTGRRGLAPGTIKMLAGAVMALAFGVGTIGSTAIFVESLHYGFFFSDELTSIVVCLVACGVGVGMFLSGRELRSREERYTNYLAYIGANRQVSLAPMAAAMDVSVRRLTRDLRKMLATHVLPTGYLDIKAGKLVLTEMGYTEPPEPEPEPEKQEEPTPEDDILREIRLINDLIPDPVISAKIDRIEEITKKILQYQKTHPQRTQQLRTFLSYYLPTTLKILRSYARLDAQGVEGENITAAKKRIEEMMDQVVQGFEKQLDKLFSSDAMDIAADVQVLENMLKKDGLSGNDMNLD
ncbi:5-bromo-4-chloroindolyl phosphate hydrolysis family protein [Pseudoflavonifractor capillosus]|uniref:5-bromo-4-chloroindolyl phosphate hydrolysis family protein n=1 Tax=Pseudoflavonifractor capillosus TaxID=106588 RepID=UPI001FAE7D6C|nr:5-bromo-4-chloroindolyl phosphate hydrolysis family protein [Pseudoflavonifractor capillosus]